MCRLPQALSRILIVVLAAGCGEAEVRGDGAGNGGASGSVATNRPSGNGAGGANGGSSTGGGGSGLSVPEPNATPAPPDAAPIQCAAEAHAAEIVPLDLMLLVDRSGSMDGRAGNRSKWETAQAALRSFVGDPKSDGLGIGMQFFPLERACTTDQECSPGATSNGRYCLGAKVCGGPDGPVTPLLGCFSGGYFVIGPIVLGCPSGSTCETAGTCSTSGAVCTNVGQPCPMGGGTCEAGPRTCEVGPSTACQEANYEAPRVSFGTLPAIRPAFDRALSFMTPEGGTPMGPAVRGVLGHLRAHLQANPGRKVVLVLASDGLPGYNCMRNDIPSIAEDLAAAFAGAPSIPTYVIGVFTPDELPNAEPQLNQLAMSGGTNAAFVLSATDDLNARLLEALNQIRGAALACEYQIPASQMGGLDYGKVNVRYTGSAGPEDIPYVERIDRCDPMRGGWYYDVDPAMGKPARVLVCPATCTRFKDDQSAKVELVFGCATRGID